MGDHTETLQIDYDPQVISFNRLLDIFWNSHNPTRQSWPRQYMHAVFYHDVQQQKLALESLDALAEASPARIETKILPLRSFTLAEDYHQKYLLKQQINLKEEMQRYYPQHQAFVDSTAVARLNGYAGGYGSDTQLKRDIDRLGLSEAGRRALADMVRRKSNYDRY
jgi:peptide methionine sulfoxide reductase MsrA